MFLLSDVKARLDFEAELVAAVLIIKIDGIVRLSELHKCLFIGKLPTIAVNKLLLTAASSN